MFQMTASEEDKKSQGEALPLASLCAGEGIAKQTKTQYKKNPKFCFRR